MCFMNARKLNESSYLLFLTKALHNICLVNVCETNEKRYLLFMTNDKNLFTTPEARGYNAHTTSKTTKNDC